MNPTRKSISQSVTLKLFFAFLAVSFVGIAAVSLFIGVLVSRAFTTFTDTGNQSALSTQLRDFYVRSGSWDGVDQVDFDNRATIDVGEAFLLDMDNNLIWPPGESLEDKVWWEEQLLQTILIQVDGEPAGQIVAETIGRNFSIDVRNGLILSSLGAFALALLLGRTFSRNLALPLRELTTATEIIAAGDFSHAVPIRTEDELGDLATSFNTMVREIERSRTLRRQLTADIAHDLRTPLGLILGHAEALKDGVLPATPETLALIHDEALHLNHLVQDLRTLSLVEAGELPLHLVETDIAHLLEQTCMKYRPNAIPHNITLICQTNPDLPHVQIDPDRMARVLGNLVSNALRYAGREGNITLSAGVEPSTHTMAIRVSDTGVGIDPDRLPYIFDRFYRGDKARNRTQGGSGLGLAIAKSIVEQHGGKISVESEVGQGTTFLVQLPVGTT